MRLFASSDSGMGANLSRLPTWESHRRSKLVSLLIVGVIVGWGATDVRWRARIDPQNPGAHKTDFSVYTEAGRAFFDGRDPYAVTNPRGWHYLYPPLFALVVAPLAGLDSRMQSMVWYVVSVAACFGAWRECRRLLRHVSDRSNSQSHDITPRDAFPSSFGWLAAATILLPALNCLQRGQVGIVLVYLLLLGARLTVTSTGWGGIALGGMILALPVTIKLTPLLPVGYLLLLLVVCACMVRRTYGQTVVELFARGPTNRAAAAVVGQAAGIAFFLFIVPALLIGHDENTAHLKTWLSHVVVNDDVGIDNEFNVRSKRNQSLSNAVKRLGNGVAFATGRGPDDRLVDDPANLRVAMPTETMSVDRALGIASFGVVGLLLAAGWRVARCGETAGIVAMFGLACAATLIVSPISWGHHYVLWLPALVFVPYWLWQCGRRTLALGLAVAALALVLAHYLAMDHAGRLGLLGIGACLWYCTATIAVGWPQRHWASPGEESKPAETCHEVAVSIGRAA
jgi:hypothetical protein